MATWNGSFFELPEDPNCYSHPDQRNTDPNIQPWNYYPEGRDNTFYGGIPNACSKNNLALFEQNGSTAFQQIAPSIPPNSVPLANAYHETQAAPAQGRNVNYSQCIFENSKLQQQLPPFNCKSGNYNGKQGRNSVEAPFFSNQRSVDPGLVEFSNLHPNAGEFVPYNLKSDFNDAPITINEIVQNVSRFGNPEYGFQDGNLTPSQGPSGVFYGDDKMGWNDKKYVNKKSSHYRQREPDENPSQNENFYRSAYKNQYPKNHGKFHNDKYVNRRQYMDNGKHYTMEKKGLISDTTVNAGNVDATKDNSAINMQFREEGDKSPNERSSKNGSRSQALSNAGHPHSFKQDSARYANRMPRYYNGSVKESPSNHNLDAEHSQVSFKHAKRYFNDDRAERYREKKGSRSDRHDTSYWEKKNSYQDYNGRRGNYEREDRNDKMKDKDRSKDSVKEIRDKDNENWRRKIEDDGSRSGTPKRSSGRRHETDDDASQRETLTEQLNRGQLECLVCCDRIKQNDSVWSCSNCYHVLHLRCTKKWARSSQSENGWRCPACQNVTTHVPEDYYCFCGKATDPEWNRRDAAHSCGDMCGRMRSNTECVHKCNLLCHPGPCPPCTAMVTKYCGCGKTFQTLKCSTGMLLLCDAVCGKLLNCTMHECERVCHHGDCGVCEKTVHQECYCGKHNREVSCEADVSSAYECTDVCDKLLECGNHKCTATCHPGSCEPCSLKPETVTHCCCGQTALTEERKSCLDEIPTCDKTCSKRLKCGQPGNPHTCEIKCHQGDCPECELTTKVKCRCGNMDKEIPCKELTTKADDARCQKRCVKKRSCGRHKCNQLCCIDIEHICPLPCSKTMSCGRHKCEQPCHKGKCQPCWRSSFDELYCECGSAVTYPPVPCGSRRPTCDKPCSRQHGCGHEVLHNCHSEATCPPCTVLTQRWCYGKHELRKAVPCHVNELSCGLSCNKPLSCGRHKCIAICHPGPCEKPGQVCTQPCVIPRELCGHTCAAPCHEGKCPDTPCKEMVKVTCQCGHKSMSRACAENSREYQRIASGILASKMAEMQLGHSVDLEEVFGQGAKKQNQLKTLECNDECKMIERNRRLALGLQIVNPDLSGKLMPRYSDFMKQWAKKDPHFCQMVHDKLTELVQLAKTSKQKSRSYSFESMNRDKRHFVHECCEQFGCESHSYDQEPKRNIVATAVKDKCWLPSLSLLELIQRENGQRRVPGPMLNTSKAPNSLRNVEVLPLFAKKSKKTLPSTSKSPEPVIDYFDYQG